MAGTGGKRIGVSPLFWGLGELLGARIRERGLDPKILREKGGWAVLGEEPGSGYEEKGSSSEPLRKKEALPGLGGSKPG